MKALFIRQQSVNSRSDMQDFFDPGSVV